MKVSRFLFAASLGVWLFASAPLPAQTVPGGASTNTAPEPTPTPQSKELEEKLRKEAEELKRDMDKKLQEAREAAMGMFDSAKKKLADTAKAAQQAMATPTPTPTPAPTPVPAPETPATGASTPPPGKPTSEGIAANPEPYLGHFVTLNANIKSIEEGRFIIDGDIIVPANMDALDRREGPRDKIEVKNGNLVRTTVLPDKIGRTIAEVILVPGQIIAINGKVERVDGLLYIRGNVTKAP